MAEAVTGYTIVTATTLYGLESHVREHIIKGFQPMGGVCVIRGTIYDNYYQAMVK